MSKFHRLGSNFCHTCNTTPDVITSPELSWTELFAFLLLRLQTIVQETSVDGLNGQ